MKNKINIALIILNIWVLCTCDFKEKEEYISTEIKGMVKSPGVYKIPLNSNVNDLILSAGGLLDSSDTSVSNLARRLNDGDVVIIYSKDEVSEMRKGSLTVKYIDKECSCPMITNASILTSYISNIDNIVINNFKISLNSATIEELTTIPGIGEAKAKLIIEYREKNNGFKTIEEIMNVKGIGKSSFEKIKDYLTL